MTDADVDKAIENRATAPRPSFPSRAAPLADGDYAQLKLMGMPAGGGEPLEADSVLCHVGGEETMEAFNENLRGAKRRRAHKFRRDLSRRLSRSEAAGKTLHLRGGSSGHQGKEAARTDRRIRQGRERRADARRIARQSARKPGSGARSPARRQRCAKRCWPRSWSRTTSLFPKRWSSIRWTRAWNARCAALAAQGVDPRAVNVDWVALRSRQKDRAIEDVKAELLLDRIATAENIEVTDEEVEKEIARIARAQWRIRHSRSRQLDKARGAR